MVPNEPRILQQYGEALLKTGQFTKGCDLTLKALESDPVTQSQTNSDKHKSDAVFACFMDDWIDLGLELAERISHSATKTLLYATSLAIQKSGTLIPHSWLTSGLIIAREEEFEAAIEDIHWIDMVIHNTLMEVYTQNIVPLRGDLNFRRIMQRLFSVEVPRIFKSLGVIRWILGVAQRGTGIEY